MSAETEPIRLGISSCLLGRAVRYDAGHKRDRFLVERLGEFVEWVPVCPEVEVGMPIPRPAMRLIRDRDAPRLVEIQSGADHTRRMERFSAQRVRSLRRLELCGYVLKKDSPSCGMERVKVYSGKGMPRRDGRGLYATALLRAFPNLPVEEEGRLQDPVLRENFIERIFAYRRLRTLFRGPYSHRQIIDFHTAHKLQLMAHAPAAYRELGRQVAALEETPRAEFRTRYQAAFMGALSRPATRGRHANALQHAAGHLKVHLDADSRAELAELIHDYRKGLIPLVVPMTLISHHIRRFGVSYLQQQVFFDPHPRELMLRNHV